MDVKMTKKQWFVSNDDINILYILYILYKDIVIRIQIKK